MDEIEKVVEETTEQPVEVHETQTEQKPKTVPLDKFLSEKARRKDLERRIAELEKRNTEEPTAKYVEKYTALGFDEAAARQIAEDFAHITRQNAKKEERDVIGEEIADLVIESEFFDDAKAFEKEIRDAIAKGDATDVRSAYLRVRDPDQRAMEIASRRKATVTTKAMPVSKPAEPKSDALTEDERAELEVLKRTQDWMDWDADSYKKYVRGRNKE